MRGTLIAGADSEGNPRVRLEDNHTLISLRPNHLLRKPFSIGEPVLLDSITRDAPKGIDFTRCYCRKDYDPAEIRTVSFETAPWMAEETKKSFAVAWKEGADAAVFFDPLVLWEGLKTVTDVPSFPLFVAGVSAYSVLNTLAFLTDPAISETGIRGYEFGTASYSDFYSLTESLGCRPDETYQYGKAWGAILQTHDNDRFRALSELLKSGAWHDVIRKSGLSEVVAAVLVSLPGLNRVLFHSPQIERDMAFSCMEAMNQKMAEPAAGN